jgi:hypothetical protein
MGEVVYTYSVGGQRYGGDYEEPFITLSSAEEYVSQFPVGSNLRVRVKPADLQTSFLCDEDQSVSGTET